MHPYDSMFRHFTVYFWPQMDHSRDIGDIELCRPLLVLTNLFVDLDEVIYMYVSYGPEMLGKSEIVGSNFESCVWRAVSSYSFDHPRWFSRPGLDYMCTKVA